MTRKKTTKKTPPKTRGKDCPVPGHELNERQLLAANIYMGLVPEHADCAGSHVASYRAAGYSSTDNATKAANQLFRTPKVGAYIRHMRQRAQSLVEMTQADIVHQYEHILQADLAALVRKAEGVMTVRDLEEWTQVEKDCIDTMEWDNEGNVKLKLVSRAEAREKLGKHLGMWPSRHEVTHQHISAADRIMAAHYRLTPEEYVQRAAEGTLPEAPALPEPVKQLRHH